MPGSDYAHVQDDVSQHILCRLYGSFSLDAAHFMDEKHHNNKAYLLKPGTTMVK